MTVFAEKILERATEAFPGHQLDEDLIVSQLIDVFIDGLRDPLACKRILRDTPATFQGGVDIAVGEARLNAKIFGRNVGFPPAMPAPQKRREEQMEVEAVGKQQPGGVCYACGQDGHFARDCQKGRPRPKFVGRCYYCQKVGHRIQKKKIGSKKTRLGREETEKVSSTATGTKRVLTIGPSTGRPSVTVNIGKVRTRALLDSGSEVTFVSGSFFRQIKNDSNVSVVRQKPLELFAANGSSLQNQGEVEIVFKITTKSFKRKFVVVPELGHSIIIGWDLILFT